MSASAARDRGREGIAHTGVAACLPPFPGIRIASVMLEPSDFAVFTDPVCGAPADLDSPFRRIQGGALVCFCSIGCRDLFAMNPARYARYEEADSASIRELQEAPAPTIGVALDRKVPEAEQGARVRLRAPGARGGGYFAALFPWRERRFARRVSKELLTLYRVVAAKYAALHGRELYRLVVTLRTRGNLESADALIDHAEDSFAEWPVRRDVTFRDVVHYIAVSEFLASHGDAPWVHANFRREVASRIPSDL